MSLPASLPWQTYPDHDGWWHRARPGETSTVIYVRVGGGHFTWGWDREDDPETIEFRRGERWLPAEEGESER